MSERETWLPFSDTLGRYIGYAQQTPAMCDETCGNRNEFEFEGSTDWRTQRIPPPAEIEANARDAARYRWLRGGAWEQDAGTPVVFDSESGLVPIDGDKLDTAIDAAMKGGE